MTRFDGQVVIVTGAASGIGLGIARAFHDAGASVVLGDVREDALDQARATFSDQERLAFVPVDVRDAAAVANLVATAEQAFGPPAVMIANAGIVPNASVLNMDVSAWDAVIETNLRGVFLSCQAAARSMVAHETRGRIVTISSIAHSYGRLGASAYCASKAGAVMFTKVLAARSSTRFPGDGVGNPMRSPKLSFISVPRALSTLPGRSCPWTAALAPGGPICRIARPSSSSGHCRRGVRLVV